MMFSDNFNVIIKIVRKADKNFKFLVKISTSFHLECGVNVTYQSILVSAAIFKGKYGSDYENKLEAEHDFLADRQKRVGAAKYKWTNGRNLLNHATAQLCVACKKWMLLPNMNPA